MFFATVVMWAPSDVVTGKVWEDFAKNMERKIKIHMVNGGSSEKIALDHHR